MQKWSTWERVINISRWALPLSLEQNQNNTEEKNKNHFAGKREKHLAAQEWRSHTVRAGSGSEKWNKCQWSHPSARQGARCPLWKRLPVVIGLWVHCAIASNSISVRWTNVTPHPSLQKYFWDLGRKLYKDIHKHPLVFKSTCVSY